MPDLPERYEPTGEEGLHDHLSSLHQPPQHQPHQSPQPQPQSQHGSREYDRYSSKSKEIEREKERTRDREWGQDRDKDCDHHQTYHRDQQWERNERNEKGYDDDYHQSRDFDRQMDHDREEEDKHGNWFRCHSNVRSSHRSRSHSRPKRKRISGFDLPPPVSAAGTGQIPGTAPAISGQPSGTLPVVPVQLMTQQAARHARRVYVGGLSPSANEQSVASFFSQVMTAIGGNTAGRGDAVVNVYINHDKKFAFVEMRSVEEASNAMALDGIIFEGVPVKVRRPSDYNPSLAATLGPSEPHPHLNLAAVGLIPGSDAGLEGPDRIFVGGLPYYFSEAQIGELLESFGPLRGFDLVKDRETGNSKGYAFCVYQDLSVTDNACAALNGIKMGDRTLTVRRANQIACQPKHGPEDVLSHALQHIALQRLSLQSRAAVRSPTKVVSLTQLITSDELKDDGEYEDILEDMRQEAGNFGNLVNIVIPRPRPHAEPSTGVGTVFLEYADVEAATKARAGMHGRKFDGNQVVAMFYPENKFAQGKYDG